MSQFNIGHISATIHCLQHNLQKHEEKLLDRNPTGFYWTSLTHKAGTPRACHTAKQFAGHMTAEQAWK